MPVMKPGASVTTFTLAPYSSSTAAHFMWPPATAWPAGNPHWSRARKLAAAAAQLEGFYAEIHLWGPLMPEQAVQRVLAHTANHNALMRQVGCPLAPKHHWMWELCRHIRAHGNPRHNSCYPDESWNRITGRVARQVHPRTFAASVLQRLCVVIKARWGQF